MSEANKALMRRFSEELWNQGHLSVADELIAPAIHVTRSAETAYRAPTSFNAQST